MYETRHLPRKKNPIGRFETRVYETDDKIQTSNLPRFAFTVKLFIYCAHNKSPRRPQLLLLRHNARHTPLPADFEIALYSYNILYYNMLY